ncbi:MAG TPA: ABC transporter permease [Candidatus Limnocylindrales bacterium]|nr:ABC transporter permease [Candidatus Limnocylindrales bacterium]
MSARLADVRADLWAFLAASLKEIRILRRYPGTVLSFIFWPIALPLAFVFQAEAFAGGRADTAAAFAERTGTHDVAGFLFVGWATYMWLSLILWGPGTSLRTEQVRGSLEAIFLTPASRLVVLFGPAISQLIWAVWIFVIVGVALWIGFGVTIGPAEALRALGVILVGVPALYAIGALFAAVVLRFGQVHALVQGVRGLFTAVCGMSFPIVVLPEWAQVVALSLPPTYLIADLREVLLIGSGLGRIAGDLAVLAAMGLLLALLAIHAFRRTEQFARRGGQLAQY